MSLVILLAVLSAGVPASFWNGLLKKTLTQIGSVACRLAKVFKLFFMNGFTGNFQYFKLKKYIEC